MRDWALAVIIILARSGAKKISPESSDRMSREITALPCTALKAIPGETWTQRPSVEIAARMHTSLPSPTLIGYKIARSGDSKVGNVSKY